MAYETDLAYLAGIIDGEGTISFQKNHHVKCWRGWQINPRVGISNTSVPMINYLKNFFEKIKIAYSCSAKQENRKKTAYVLQVSRHSHILRLLDLVTPFLIAKKKQASLLKEWIDIQNKRHNSMYTRSSETGQITGARRQNYTERQMDIYEEVKELNYRGLRTP
jgi:hypothetical protein